MKKLAISPARWTPDSAQRAFEHLVALTNLAPRHAPNPGQLATVNYLDSHLRSMGHCPTIDVWEEMTPNGKLTFRNVILEVQGIDTSRFLVLGSHYDTKPRIQCPGANDGASSTALLLEIARDYALTPPPVNLYFCFFDGEECFRSYTANDGLHGSRRCVENLRRAHRLESCVGMILSDMIGDENLRLTLSPDTDPYWLKKIRSAAQKLNTPEKVSIYRSSILDDHCPFVDAGIKAVDLIDFEYGPGNVFWHTSLDTPERCSAESLRWMADLLHLLIRDVGEEYGVSFGAESAPNTATPEKGPSQSR